MRGALAHEIIGHRQAALAGMTQGEIWAEEAQASMRAALLAPDLSAEERLVLWQDGLDRLATAGASPETSTPWLGRP